MRETRILMGMPVTIDIGGSADDLVERIFDYFDDVDRRFSTYRTDSEISAINRGDIPVRDWSGQMLDVMKIAEQTRRQTDGYFDIHRPDGALDPSGIV
ncbi:MAG: FAD:protein FMN transferase, partial [Mesorhizobium sp.]